MDDEAACGGVCRRPGAAAGGATGTANRFDDVDAVRHCELAYGGIGSRSGPTDFGFMGFAGLFRHLLYRQRLIWHAVNSSASFSSDGFYDLFVKILTSFLKQNNATDDTFAAVTGTGSGAGLVTIAGCVPGRVSFSFPAELYIVPAGILGHAAPGIGGWNLGHVAGPGPFLWRKGEVYNCGLEPLFCIPLCVRE